MMALETSPDNRFVAAYTNNNQTILLNTLISEFIVIDNPFNGKDGGKDGEEEEDDNKDKDEEDKDSEKIGTDETVQGLCLMDTHLVIYGQYSWVVFNMAGKRLSGRRVYKETPILVLRMESLEDFTVVYWSGDESNPEKTLETHKGGKTGRPLHFHSGFAISKDQVRIA